MEPAPDPDRESRSRARMRPCAGRVEPPRARGRGRAVLLAACALLVSIATRDLAGAHGGVYRGPGDSRPPGDSSGGAGSGAPSSPGSAGSGGKSAPKGPGPSSGSGASGPSRPRSRPGASSAVDLTTWELWWGFNKEPYLNLKASIHSSALLSGSDDYFLGRQDRRQARDRLAPSEEAIHGRIVPALLRALETETHNEIVTGALIALARIGDSPPAYGRPPVARVIERFLADANQEVSETAAIALGILASRSSFEVLRDLLEDDEAGRRAVAREHEVPWRTRTFAAYGLGLIAFGQENEDLRRAAVAELARGFEAGRSMATADLQVACVTAMGLVPLPEDSGNPLGAQRAHHGRRGQVEWALRLLRDQDLPHVVRSAVPTTLARLSRGLAPDSDLRATIAAELLDLLAARTEREVRQSAVLALGAVGDADLDPVDVRIRTALEAQAARGPDLQSRQFALVALARAGARPGSGRGDPHAATGAVRSTLEGFLQRGGSSVRPWAALALGVLGRDLSAQGVAPSREIDAKLRAGLAQARAPRDVGAFAISLGLRSDPNAQELLLEKLREAADDTTRGYVAVALGLAGAVEARGAITQIVLASKYRPALLRQAAISLGLLGDKEVAEELVGMLARAGSLAARASVATAIGFVGDARSIDALVAMLSDREVTGGARGFAAVALGLVADKEPLPWNVKISVGINYRAGVETLTSPAGTGVLDIL